MTDLIEVNAANLSGEALGWAVGTAEGLSLDLAGSSGYITFHRVFYRRGGDASSIFQRFNPWEDWAVGGPLLDKHQAGLSHDRYLSGGPCGCSAGPLNSTWLSRPTPLVAFCRALVHAKLGPIVRVPMELMP